MTLKIAVKNVKTLIIKIYEINAYNYYREFDREVNTDLNLDGLVANHEETHEFEEPPLRRVSREFQFPELSGKRGIWMIEFIGNGKSSRALIRKGQLHLLTRTSPDGEVIYVLNEKNALVPGATGWLGGHSFKADDEGKFVVPFSTAGGQTSLILQDATGFASLENLKLPGETYGFQAGFYLHREQLIPGEEATLLIRPGLTIGGMPVSLDLFKETTLTLRATNLDGIETTQEIRDFKLSESEEAIHRFNVPDRTRSINFILSGKITSLTTGEGQILSQSKTFEINEIEGTAQTGDFHLSQINGHYVIDHLGRTGEILANRPALVEIRHRDFTEDINLSLQTDDHGRIYLGPLSDVVRVKVSADGRAAHRWFLTRDRHSLPSNLHGGVGEELRLPYLGSAAHADRQHFSLLEKRGATYSRDFLDALKLEDGFLIVSQLPAGNFELLLKENHHRIAIRIAAGAAGDNAILGTNRLLSRTNTEALQIESIETKADALVIQLTNHSPFTRVHLQATRFHSPFDLFDLLPFSQLEPYQRIPARRINAFLSGRKIGDEHRYIIDRRYAKRFPGNMLDRPGILLNPWEIRSTDTGSDDAADGEDFGAVAEGAPGSSPSRKAKQGKGVSDNSHFSSIDFLRTPGVLLSNLRPDDEGQLIIPRKDLGDRQLLHILAVDPQNSAFRQMSLPEAETSFADLRLAEALDSRQHFSEQQESSVLETNQSIEINRMQGAELEVYDTLGKVYRYYSTRNNDPHLD
ncbi:MAG: hypothetical protein AAF514_19600, partial [Verrucomicrobiota bacterium]